MQRCRGNVYYLDCFTNINIISEQPDLNGGIVPKALIPLPE